MRENIKSIKSLICEQKHQAAFDCLKGLASTDHDFTVQHKFSRLFKSIPEYIKRSVFTIVRIYSMFNPYYDNKNTDHNYHTVHHLQLLPDNYNTNHIHHKTENENKSVSLDLEKALQYLLVRHPDSVWPLQAVRPWSPGTRPGHCQNGSSRWEDRSTPQTPPRLPPVASIPFASS